MLNNPCLSKSLWAASQKFAEEHKVMIAVSTRGGIIAWGKKVFGVSLYPTIEEP